MRIERLDLVAFGPFRHTRLALGENPRALQVVYGRNEAGKSTTLRAITQLLYGMPHQSEDAHRHESKNLRVGATLVDVQGERVRVVRRKGRVNTLLDAEGEPLDEGLLQRLLGGTPEDLFRSMFGLNHETLRKGAEALLAGGGDLGEGLFDAGVGGAPVHRVLRELRDEADALYRPRGKVTKLNAALEAARQLAEQRRGAALLPEKWHEQKRALEKAERRHRELSEQRAALTTEQAHLTRALQVLPKLRERQRLQAERDALGQVRPLEHDATQKRLQAAAGLEASQAALARSREEQAHVAAKLAELGEPSAATLGEQVTQQLRERFGSYRNAEKELPELQAQRRALTREIDDRLAALPERVRAQTGEGYRPPADLEPRLAELSAEGRKARDALAQRSEEATEREAEIAALRAQLETLGEPEDVTRLEALLADPRAQTDVAALREGQVAVEAVLARVTRGLKELGMSLAPEALAALPLPPARALTELRDQEQALAAQQTRLHERRAEVDAELLEVRSARKALAGRGAVPSEAALGAARQARDESLDALGRTIAANERPQDEALGELRSQVEKADRLADRLWREADRVQRDAELSARSEKAVALGERLLEETAEWERAQAALQERLRTQLEPLSLPGNLSAREAERRVEAAHRLRDEAERACEQRDTLAQRESEARAFCAALVEALGETPSHAAEAPLGELGARLAEARQRAQRARDHGAETRARSEAIQTASRAHARALERRAEAEAALQALGAPWREEAARLGLEEHAGGDEVISCVRVLRELSERRADLANLDARIERLQTERRAFEGEVAGLCAQHLGGAAPEGAAEGVDRLERHGQRERDRARDRAHFGELLDKHAEEARRADAQRAECQRTLDSLCQRAGVDDAQALPEAEQAWAAAQQLDARVAELHEALLRLAEGESLEALHALTEGVVPERARARLADLEDELAGLREELEAARHEVGRVEGGLERYEEGRGAAELAEQQEARLSEVLELSHQYLVRRVAEGVLRSEVERYREAHQGPLLKRASELVGPLTLGRYVRLKEDFEVEDRPRLCMVRPDGETVEVAALSDGTRDALYLALRLSSLERFVAHNTPLPLVLDDCFIHFDDDRTRAALQVLGEYAGTLQVLLFTHHQRVVELAREALGKAGVATHDLDEARRLGEGRNDGPLFAAR